MFIIAKRNFLIPRADGTMFPIVKDVATELPADVSEHWLVKAAIADGLIIAPKTTKDKDIVKADEKAAQAEAQADIRPDAQAEAQADDKAVEAEAAADIRPDGKKKRSK